VARAYSRLGRFASALELLDQLPREPRVIYYAGCALANLGRLDEARARFQELAAGASEYSGKALTQLGHIFLRADDIGGAGDCYDRALEQDPSDEGALYAMGGLAYRMGETEIAGDCFSKILARRPDHVRARFGMGAVHEARGETREAVACYEAVQKPLDVRVRLGVSYCRNGQYEEAEQILDPLYGSTMDNDVVLYYLGMARAASGRCEEAMGMWNTLATRHPQDQGLQTSLAALYLGQALRRWESREAETLLDHALTLDARNECCRYYRALYDWKRRRLTEAAERLRELAEDGGGDARALYHLGLCLSLNGKSDEAAPYFELAARDRSSDYGRYASLAIANHHVRLGRYAEAEAALAGFV
jgi:tetratricopeptide (TPR) repeat protein